MPHFGQRPGVDDRTSEWDMCRSHLLPSPLSSPQKKNDDEHERSTPHHVEATAGAQWAFGCLEAADRENPVTGRTD